ncbi:hypothetical protein FH972_025054 [Carpinus fangiana]|uniref:Nucleolar complex protein 2 homolog n=1 Tax=Carpinus fangiana TaxID=176857 RepID=A0A5N6KZX5_9ROSI|nr:hypothetical protein FH972_025054 [Carpinus fangiana]
MAVSKSTKKFQRNNLHDVLQRRKDVKKIKQRNQIQAKKKARRAEDGLNGSRTPGSDAEDGKAEQKKKKDALGDMSVDDFFAGGFQVPEDIKAAKGKKRSGKRKRSEDEAAADDSDASIASVEDHAAMNGDGGDDELDLHKNELKALAEKDPDFYKYLQENDAELLDFAEDSNLAEIDDLILSDDEADATRSKKSKGEGSTTDVSAAMVASWSKSMTDKHSLRAMREAVLAFRAAAHLNDEDGKTYKYTISNADVYHELLLCALRQVPEVLEHHIPTKEGPTGKTRVSTDSKKFRSMTSLLKSHALSIQHLLQNLSDAGTTRTTLTSLLGLLPYLLSFKKLIRDIARTVVDIWADSAHTESTRISAFLIIRRLTVIGDAGIKEMVLKTAYQGLIKGSRNTTVHNIAGHNLMKNSAAELWGLATPTLAYTTGFTFVRQLAIHLRNSIKNNSNDSYKTVYNWQYVHSLDFWSRVLSMHCDSLREATSGKESALRPLIYPLTQVTLGAMRLIPTSAYFPLRLQLVRSLLRLSQSTDTFIPLATPLYEVLQSAEMKKPPKPSTLKPFDFDTNIRAPKGYLRTRVFQDGVGEQVVELLSEFFALWSKSVAFPELTLPLVVMLKRWLKETSPFNKTGRQSNGHGGKGGRKGGDAMAGGNRNGKLNSSVSLLIQKLDANARWIEERRAKVEFAPNNRAGVDNFLKETEWTKTPLGAFVEGQRKRLRYAARSDANVTDRA